MAAKKKKKPAPKTSASKTARRGKTVARKAAAKRVGAKKAPARKTVKAKTAKKAAPKNKVASHEFGEGNYKASKRFRTEQEAFVKKNKAKIQALGKAAEAALEGPEGESLRAAEAEAAGHGAGKR